MFSWQKLDFNFSLLLFFLFQLHCASCDLYLFFFFSSYNVCLAKLVLLSFMFSFILNSQVLWHRHIFQTWEFVTALRMESSHLMSRRDITAFYLQHRCYCWGFITNFLRYLFSMCCITMLECHCEGFTFWKHNRVPLVLVLLKCDANPSVLG